MGPIEELFSVTGSINPENFLISFISRLLDSRIGTVIENNFFCRT
jgi:hypothetical protein